MLTSNVRVGVDGTMVWYATETLALELAFQGQDGALVDLSGRHLEWVAYRAEDGARLCDPIVGESVTDGADRFTRFVLPGALSSELYVPRANRLKPPLRHQITEPAGAGNNFVIEAALIILSAAAAAAPIEGDPTSVRVTVPLVAQRVIISARGAPGETPWGRANQTYDQWRSAIVADASSAWGDRQW